MSRVGPIPFMSPIDCFRINSDQILAVSEISDSIGGTARTGGGIDDEYIDNTRRAYHIDAIAVAMRPDRRQDK